MENNPVIDLRTKDTLKTVDLYKYIYYCILQIYMNKPFISSLQNTLEKSLILLESIPKSAYVDDSVGPFYSSIGGHIRHILDFTLQFLKD